MPTHRFDPWLSDPWVILLLLVALVAGGVAEWMRGRQRRCALNPHFRIIKRDGRILRRWER